MRGRAEGATEPSTPTGSTFLSDNASGVHPEVLAALARANRGHARAYGADRFTRAAVETVRRHFGEDAEVFFVFGGTAANVLALRPIVDSIDAVLCAESSHVWRDECGAPEHFLGAKLIPVETAQGKLTVAALRPHLHLLGDVHHSQPRVVSLTQPTEWGTVYTLDELRTLCDFAHQHGLLVHLDGARLANAAVFLDCPLRATSRDVGVDVLSLGGTKNGLMGAEAIIFFDPALARRAEFHRKQAMQLASKMRFLAVQFDTLLGGDLWRESARHANVMAARLAELLGAIGGVEIVRPVESNVVFLLLPRAALSLAERWPFLVWAPEGPIVRLMTTFDTSEDDLVAFTEALATAVGA
jgi:threonine aldolase